MSVSITNVTQQPTVAPIANPNEIGHGAPKRAAQPVRDTVTLNGQLPQKVTYADPRTNKAPQSANLAAMLEESDRKAQEIIDLIRPLVEQQGLNFAKVVSGEQKLRADPATIEAAKAAISEDGEFGIRRTAERILSFAKGAIGNDPEKLDAVRAAVELGFAQAADMLGGSLPEISQRTLKAIQSEFDRWTSEGIPSGDAVTLKTAKAPG